MQRRAIEEVRPKTTKLELPAALDDADIFLAEDSTQLFVLGISIGVGTCSNIHGMNVLVLGTSPPDSGRRMNGQRIESCHYAVLYSQLENRQNLAQASVERLSFIGCDANRATFNKTGNVSIYVPI